MGCVELFDVFEGEVDGCGGFGGELHEVGGEGGAEDGGGERCVVEFEGVFEEGGVAAGADGGDDGGDDGHDVGCFLGGALEDRGEFGGGGGFCVEAFHLDSAVWVEGFCCWGECGGRCGGSGGLLFGVAFTAGDFEGFGVEVFLDIREVHAGGDALCECKVDEVGGFEGDFFFGFCVTEFFSFFHDFCA